MHRSVANERSLLLRTDSDRDAGVAENVQSRLGDEARAEHKHFAIERKEPAMN